MAKKGERGEKAKGPKRDVVVEFAQYFGSETKLDNWKRLCEDLNLEGEFTSITICRNALRRVWVNIWDFLDAIRAGTDVHKFPNQHALASYTIARRRFYPLKKAKEEGPVRALLAYIVS